MPITLIEITKTSDLFPPSLLAIGEDCPERLWLRGNPELLKEEKSVAIIGAWPSCPPVTTRPPQTTTNLLREGIACMI